jgi:VWFA-related protein
MTTRRAAVLALLVAAVTVARPAAAPPVAVQQVFRSSADAISVPVAVLEDGRPVADLPLERFALFDNGVMQDVALMAVGSLAIDVTIVLDRSGSVSGPAIAQLIGDVDAIVGELAEDDRVRLLTFSNAVRESMALGPATRRLDFVTLAPAGATAFYHGVAAALLPRAEPGRPHLVVALGDGGDNASFLEAADVTEISRRADMVLHLVIRNRWAFAPRANASRRGYGWLPFSAPMFSDELQDAAHITGGEYHEVKGDEPLGDLLKQVVRDFKTSYLLWFEPKGVPLPGWHELVVRIRGGGYQVRARRGYFGG